MSTLPTLNRFFSTWISTSYPDNGGSIFKKSLESGSLTMSIYDSIQAQAVNMLHIVSTIVPDVHSSEIDIDLSLLGSPNKD